MDEQKVKALAADIQINVDKALKNPGDNKALDALHRDSYQLSEGPNKGKGKLEALQDAVQKELIKLEKNGSLPGVTISTNGQITASIRINFNTVRNILADPEGVTHIWPAYYPNIHPDS